jgi:hypothetical protein
MQQDQLQIWLDLPTTREQRRFLEAHSDLLSEQSETRLHHLSSSPAANVTQAQQRRETLLIIQDARQRGSTAQAIREAYINIYGGFVLDIPSWLEVVEQRLKDFLNQNRFYETAETRVGL